MLTESQQRLYDKLYSDLGDKIISYITDPDVNEIMLNPDGGLWVDSVKDGLSEVCKIPSIHAFSIIYSIAELQGSVVSVQNPRIETELPHYRELRGERFTGQISPIVSNPCFTLRKKSSL